MNVMQIQPIVKGWSGLAQFHISPEERQTSPFVRLRINLRKNPCRLRPAWSPIFPTRGDCLSRGAHINSIFVMEVAPHSASILQPCLSCINFYTRHPHHKNINCI